MADRSHNMRRELLSMGRRADPLAATVQTAFGSARDVTAAEDEAMCTQVAQRLRRSADADRAALSQGGSRAAQPPVKAAH